MRLPRTGYVCASRRKAAAVDACWPIRGRRERRGRPRRRFAQSRRPVHAILTGPAGDGILPTAIATKAQGAGLDSYSAKMMFGDWLWWADPVAQVTRLVSPQGFVAGRLANLSPEQSSLNKPLYAVVGSQRSGTPGSGQATKYASAELSVLLQAGIDVIANPQPAGSFWGVRGGHNSSTDPSVNGDNYTRMTNYIAATLAAGMGQYVGEVINAALFRRIRATQMSFLQAMLGQGSARQHRWQLAVLAWCATPVEQPAEAARRLGYVQSGRADSISGHQRALHREHAGRPDGAGAATDVAGRRRRGLAA